MPAAQSHIERIALPRLLLGRRKIQVAEYAFAFELGQRVVLVCTNEPAIVTGRTQVIGCHDEYVVELIDVDAPPLNVQQHQIQAIKTVRTYSAAWRFSVGDTVQFAGSLAVVTGRQRSAHGIEIYSIFLIGVRERPHRTVRGAALKHTH
jgi:hypothetical protein